MWDSLLGSTYTDPDCERVRRKLLRLVADGEIGCDTASAQMQAAIDRHTAHAEDAVLEQIRGQVLSSSPAGRRR
jgi:hypothetical protein